MDKADKASEKCYYKDYKRYLMIHMIIFTKNNKLKRKIIKEIINQTLTSSIMLRKITNL